MRNLVLTLLALLAVPAFAVDPNITIDVDGSTVTVGYTADAADLVSGFGLVVTTDGTISNFTDLSADYWVHPSNIQIDAGEVTSEGSAIAAQTASSITVEFGALYDGEANAPATVGDLFSFDVAAGTTVSVASTHAGGIVTEGLNAFEITRAADLAPAVPYAGTKWDAAKCAGQPNGDATCDGAVNLADLFALKASWGKAIGVAGYNCGADFDHSGAVNLADLFKLKANWGSAGYTPSEGNATSCPTALE